MSVLRLSEVPLAERAQRHQTVLDAHGSGDPGGAEAVLRCRILDLPSKEQESALGTSAGVHSTAS